VGAVAQDGVLDGNPDSGYPSAVSYYWAVYYNLEVQFHFFQDQFSELFQLMHHLAIVHLHIALGHVSQVVLILDPHLALSLSLSHRQKVLPRFLRQNLLELSG
jgi:hypothetical protein